MPPPPPADLPSPAVGLPSSNFPIYSQDSIDQESLDGKFSLLYPPLPWLHTRSVLALMTALANSSILVKVYNIGYKCSVTNKRDIHKH